MSGREELLSAEAEQLLDSVGSKGVREALRVLLAAEIERANDAENVILETRLLARRLLMERDEARRDLAVAVELAGQVQEWYTAYRRSHP